MTAASDPVVIVSFARTPMGGFQGALSPVKATDLGAAAVKAAVERAGVAPEKVEQIFMGCVLPAGLGQAPARQAAIGAGLGKHVEATTVNKMCGSGLQAAMMAHDALLAGTAEVIVAGGMESMTGAPYLMNKHRSGARIGHDVIVDSMMMDGLEDAYSPGKAMGVFAEDSAAQYQFTREAMDAYAIESLTRAKAAIASGAFKAEIVPVEVATRKGPVTVSEDEQPGKADAAKIPTLRPAFTQDGAITAANASSISDGAASAIACATACTASLVDFVSAIAKSACANSARLPTLVSTCASRRRISPVDRLTTKPEQPLLPGSGSTVPKGTTCVPVVPSSATSSRCTIAPR